MKKIIVSSIIILIILLGIVNNSFGVEGIDTEKFKIGIGIDIDLSNKLGAIIGIVQLVGVGIALIACVIMGIRYVTSSVEDRADIKKKLIPYVIGTVIFFGATGILQLISSVAKWFYGDYTA